MSRGTSRQSPPAHVRRRRRIDAVFLAAQLLLGAGLLLVAARVETGPPSTVRLGLATTLATLSLGVGIVALRRLRHSFRIVPTPSADGRLERSGIYRWLRHPMYYAVLGLVSALCLLRPHPLVLGLGVLNYLFYWIKSRHEEQLLLRRYPEYAGYRRRTRGVGP